jgi:hypothetical protein
MNTENVVKSRPSTKYLENIKNKVLLKLKVQESIDILPKNYETLANNDDVEISDNVINELL